MTKILFLDIDGVLNCETTTQRHNGIIGIDPRMALLVRKILTDVPDLKVVLSSSWRLAEHNGSLEEVEKKVCKLFDHTPRFTTPPGMTDSLYASRGREIQAWLDDHFEVDRYAIVDDHNWMLPEQQKHFFKTSWSRGLTPEIAQKITEHLL